MSLRRQRTPVPRAWLVCVLVVACRGEPQMEEDPTPVKQATTGEDEGDASGSSGEVSEDAGQDSCVAAPAVLPGSYRASLVDMSPDGGTCGGGGPDVFFRIEVARRSDVEVHARGDGFEPRVAVSANDCAIPFEEGGLLCTQGVPGWVSDVAAGTQLLIGVGASEAELDASPTGVFELDVRTREVLSVGERCGEERWGRCEGGTTCAVPEDTEEPEVCVLIPGDRCGNAMDVRLSRGSTTLSVEPGALHSDAHHHSCGGDRSAERVFRLRLPALSTEARLRIEGENVRALAARTPTCLPEEEAGCSAATEPSIELDGVLPQTIYLFVELPTVDPEASEQTPSFVRLGLIDG